jgi:adenosylcobinamide hydrolase
MEETPDTLIIRFTGPRKVLSTSWLNGGYREDLTAVFNHQISTGACEACHSGGSVKNYLERVARSSGLDAGTVTGLVTRAEMKNAVVSSASFRDLSVCSVVTGGIDKNAVRAGVPASYYENGNTFEPVGGTINTILMINADIPEYAMSRAIITATEAKAAALQQIMAPSLRSTGFATGSGTDMIAVVANPSSPHKITDAGTHSKCGELIGRTVIEATLAAVEKETGVSTASQRNALIRLFRYGITEKSLLKEAKEHNPQYRDPDERKRFLTAAGKWAVDPCSVTLVAAALHIVDEAEWGLLLREDASRRIAGIVNGNTDIRVEPDNGNSPVRTLTTALSALITAETAGGISPGDR